MENPLGATSSNVACRRHHRTEQLPAQGIPLYRVQQTPIPHWVGALRSVPVQVKPDCLALTYHPLLLKLTNPF